jgi:hypothetical protein
LHRSEEVWEQGGAFKRFLIRKFLAQEIRAGGRVDPREELKESRKLPAWGKVVPIPNLTCFTSLTS